MGDQHTRNIFVSYAREDRDTAAALARKLRQEPGLNVWVDSDALFVGADVRASIHEALKKADIVIALVTPRYLDSAWGSAELGAAWMLGTPVLALVDDERLLQRLPEGLTLSKVVHLGPDADYEVAEALSAA